MKAPKQHVEDDYEGAKTKTFTRIQMGLFRSTVIYKVQFNIPLAGADFVGGGGFLWWCVGGGGAGTSVPLVPRLIRHC